MRAGTLLSLVAIALGVTTAITLRVTASELEEAITLLVVVGAGLHAGCVLVGSSRWVAMATAPVVGAIAVEAGVGDDPSWLRSILVGCLWYVTMEVSWEAIDRRDGAIYSTAANLARVQRVATVTGVSLGLGVVATLAALLAPVRSVGLQALVLAAVLLALVTLARHVTSLVNT